MRLLLICLLAATFVCTRCRSLQNSSSTESAEFGTFQVEWSESGLMEVVAVIPPPKCFTTSPSTSSQGPSCVTLSASSTSSNATITAYPTCGVDTTIPASQRGKCPDAQATLDAHNKLRAQWGAPPLLWSGTLANYAQSVSDKCVFQHSNGPYGENLAIGRGLTCVGAFNLWASEAKNWPPGGTPEFSSSTGHFSALVWKSTTKVGCGIRSCSDGNIVTCSYNPPGNYNGQFDTQVGYYGQKPPCVAPPHSSSASVPGMPGPAPPMPEPTVPASTTPASFPSFPGFPKPFKPIEAPSQEQL